MHKLQNILVTGGCGFIGSNFINLMFGFSRFSARYEISREFSGKIINLDKLTYAANQKNVEQVEKKYAGSRYFFEQADICDSKSVEEIIRKYNIDTIVHFAAETHVDRSISGPEIFVKTNVLGTQVLLEAARKAWNCSLTTPNQENLFHYISTDEVYGSLDFSAPAFTENSNYNPSSPYSASKASAELLVFSYSRTFGLPVTVSSCSNNYGPNQNPEKLIPLMLHNMEEGKALPVYGNGKNVRDWIFVDDHNAAVWQILKKGQTGSKYNIGGQQELANIQLIEKLIEIMAAARNKSPAEYKSLVQNVTDRPGHDLRYAVDCTKIKTELHWSRKVELEEGLKALIE